jgi:hypothetical protein
MTPKAAVAYAELQIVGYATKKGTFDGHGRTAAPGSGSGMTQTTMFSPQAQRKYIDVARRTLNLSRIEIVDAWFARIDRYTPATSLLSLRWKNANLSSASWAGAAAASFNSIFPGYFHWEQRQSANWPQETREETISFCDGLVSRELGSITPD